MSHGLWAQDPRLVLSHLQWIIILAVNDVLLLRRWMKKDLLMRVLFWLFLSIDCHHMLLIIFIVVLINVAIVFIIWPIGQTALTESAILNAAMPMATIYPLLGQKYGHEGLCAASLMATTVLAFITVTSLIGLFRVVACC